MNLGTVLIEVRVFNNCVGDVVDSLSSVIEKAANLVGASMVQKTENHRTLLVFFCGRVFTLLLPGDDSCRSFMEKVVMFEEALLTGLEEIGVSGYIFAKNLEECIEPYLA